MTARLAGQRLGYMAGQILEDDGNDGRKEIDENEYFFPAPKITFIVDQPSKLLCQICQDTPLKLEMTSRDYSDRSLSILPCGHVGCYGCLNNWVKSHKKCPFCREDMRRYDCSHFVKPVVLAYDTIQTIPKTLARNGKIADSCTKCDDKVGRETIKKIKSAGQFLRNARRHCEKSNTDITVEDVEKLEASFESYAKQQALEDMYERTNKW
ncbi:hypothetical protein F4818DRAFT_441471 [Hypoxylon cercidicola]|nr:hypothetical protein F4818DRAFT_441471 [Hypoxylon cercidicola]